MALALLWVRPPHALPVSLVITGAAVAVATTAATAVCFASLSTDPAHLPHAAVCVTGAASCARCWTGPAAPTAASTASSRASTPLDGHRVRWQ